MVKKHMLAVGDTITVYLSNGTISGQFLDECDIGIVVSDEKEKNKYRLIPIEAIQHLEYIKKKEKNVKKK